MKKYLLPLILILFLTFTLIGNSADWLDGWSKRIELSINDYAGNIGASVTWFPVTVFLNSTQAEEVFAELTTDAEYLKVAFTKADGTTELYAEKELFTHYASQYPPAQSDTYVKATTFFENGYQAYYATDPTKSLTEDFYQNIWLSSAGTVTNQRFHIDLGSAKIIKRIYYENLRRSFGDTNRGVQNFTFWGSNTGAGTFDDLVYVNNEGWTQITTSQATFDRHIEADVVDPKYITVINSTAYRYYAFKFADNYSDDTYMGVRRIELQTEGTSEEGEAIYHISRDGWTINANTSIFLYYDSTHADNNTYIGAIGARTEVWDGNFKAIYHMTDLTTSTIEDSTSNNNDGTKKGVNEPNEVEEKVGQGQDFDDDYIFVTDSASLTTTTTGTWSVIIKGDDLHTNLYQFILGKRVSGGSALDAYNILITPTNGSNNIVAVIGDGTNSCAAAYSKSNFTNGVYYLLTMRWDGTNIKLFVNDIERGTGSQTNDSHDNAANLYFGRETNDTEGYFDGIIGESHFSNTDRSNAWIKGTYNSWWGNLFTYGSEEEAPAVAEVNAIFSSMIF